MRITHLSIQNYKNLKDFNWTIDADYSIALIVGKNASGKSNLMEAILHIFACVQRDKQQETDFDYQITYEIETPHKQKVRLESQGGKFSAWRDGEEIEDQQTQVELLPRKIFAYYAGTSKRIEDTIDLYPSFIFEYYAPIKYKFALFALLASPHDKIKKDFLQKDFGIEGLHNVTFEIQKPTEKQASPENTKPSKDNFWNASGDLLTLFEIFQELSNQSNKNTLQFTFDGIVINQILTDFPRLSSESDLFETMIQALELGYIRDLTLNLKKTGVDEGVIFEDFSEGEKQRIAIRGIIELYKGDETLYLLDEPDAFAHPRWQWEFIPDLEKALASYSQVIYVTHSPIVLSSITQPAFMMKEGVITEMNPTFGNSVNETLAAEEVDYRQGVIADNYKKYLIYIQNEKAQTSEALELRASLIESLGEQHPLIKDADDLIDLYA